MHQIVNLNSSVPYHLKPGEPVPAEITRIVREEIDAAAGQLSGQGEANRDEAIHEARKNVKKIRGVLRLVQPELGEVYRAENVRFRDIGRKLSHYRDAGAMLEAFDALLEAHRDELGRRKFPSIRRGLMRRKQEAEQEGNLDVVLRQIAATLRRSAQRDGEWPLKQDGFQAIEPGLLATFRRGRKTLKLANRHPSAENFHEWRKRVKEHWYHVRLLEEFWSGSTEAYEKKLKELETALGEDHNLVLLQEKIEAEPAFYGRPPEVALFMKLMEKYHKKMRAQALHLGKSLYDDKPSRFTRHLRRLWESKES